MWRNGPCIVTLIGGRADDGRRADARAGMAGVRLRAGVTVIAGRAVRLRAARAGAGRRVTGPCVVALIGRRADDGARAGCFTRQGRRADLPYDDRTLAGAMRPLRAVDAQLLEQVRCRRRIAHAAGVPPLLDGIVGVRAVVDEHKDAAVLHPRGEIPV